MIEKNIAIISDIHGNSIALSEVIKDIRSRNIDTIINLGDSLYGPLDPKGTFDLLVSNKVISISGNQDRIILENLHHTSDLITLEYVKSQIDSTIVDWLKSLPFDMIYEDTIYCCHASPQSDMEYLLECLETNYVALKDELRIDTLLSRIKQKVVICGHSHIPRIVEIAKKLIVNPGSVGLPAYDDDLPVYHKMENYNPRANYAILTINGDSILIDRISIDYNHEKSAQMAETNMRNDWAKWIRTGRV